MKNVIVNFTLFQFGWFACVLSGATDRPWLGSSIAVLIIMVHILLSKGRRQEVYLVASAMIIGTAWDSLLISINLIEYPYGQFLENTAPYWIVILWGLFATTLNSSLAWLQHKLIIASLLGVVAGPLAYYAGQEFGAIKFIDTNMAIVALAVGWAIFTPLLLSLSNFLNHDSAQMMRSV
jgi:hypothetical protein